MTPPGKSDTPYVARRPIELSQGEATLLYGALAVLRANDPTVVDSIPMAVDLMGRLLEVCDGAIG